MKSVDLQRPYIVVACVAFAFIAVAASLVSCYVNRVPDVSLSEAASIISRAPEFNRYARLVKVQSIYPLKDSMEGASFGKFNFFI